jgi:hypothetical protein
VTKQVYNGLHVRGLCLLLAIVINFMTSILSAVDFVTVFSFINVVAIFSSINVVQLYEYTLGVLD